MAHGHHQKQAQNLNKKIIHQRNKYVKKEQDKKNSNKNNELFPSVNNQPGFSQNQKLIVSIAVLLMVTAAVYRTLPENSRSRKIAIGIIDGDFHYNTEKSNRNVLSHTQLIPIKDSHICSESSRVAEATPRYNIFEVEELWQVEHVQKTLNIPKLGHGNMMSSIIGGDQHLMEFSVDSYRGSCSITAGIKQAKANKLPIINCSVGIYDTSFKGNTIDETLDFILHKSKDSSLIELYNEMNSYPGVMVFGVPNENRDLSQPPFAYPGLFGEKLNHPERLILVAATMRKEGKLQYSSITGYSPQVDLVVKLEDLTARYDEILKEGKKSTPSHMFFTYNRKTPAASESTAFVSRILGLMLEANPDVPLDELKNLLIQSSTLSVKDPSGRDVPVLNPKKAIQAAKDYQPKAESRFELV